MDSTRYSTLVVGVGVAVKASIVGATEAVVAIGVIVGRVEVVAEEATVVIEVGETVSVVDVAEVDSVAIVDVSMAPSRQVLRFDPAISCQQVSCHHDYAFERSVSFACTKVTQKPEIIKRCISFIMAVYAWTEPVMLSEHSEGCIASR